METILYLSYIDKGDAFQKDLIVWKRKKARKIQEPINAFQKDLIVWKLDIFEYLSRVVKNVSEGLNSVETG